MKYESLILIGILLLAGLLLGSGLKRLGSELLKVEKVEKYEFSLAAKRR